MKTRAELKMDAKQQLKGNYGLAIGVLLTTVAISLLVFVPFIGGILVFLAAPSLALGVIMVYQRFAHYEKPSYEEMFHGFQYFGKALLLYILVAVFTFLWSLLLIVPGIVKSFSYSMSFYILAEHPEMTALEALNESKRIMDGHKLDLFVLMLSFLGWMILCSLTFGILLLYVEPYMYATYVNFYNMVKEQHTISGPEIVQGQ